MKNQSEHSVDQIVKLKIIIYMDAYFRIFCFVSLFIDVKICFCMKKQAKNGDVHFGVNLKVLPNLSHFLAVYCFSESLYCLQRVLRFCDQIFQLKNIVPF